MLISTLKTQAMAIIATYAVFKCRRLSAIVALVLLEQVDEVEHDVALAAHENVRGSHLALRFCKLEEIFSICGKPKQSKKCKQTLTGY